MDLQEEDVEADRNCIVGNPVLEALYNDVILDNIFKSSNNLKNCRLVCNKWKDLIHSQKPARLSLNLYKVYENTPTTEVVQVSQERELVKRISIDYVGKAPRLPGVLQQFCEQYGQEVCHLHFKTNYKNNGNFKDVQHVLENNLCPNLRRLEGDKIENDTISCPFLPILPKLEFIGIKFLLREDKFDEGQKSFFQLLLNNAPNLHAIKYNGPFDLDFGPNKKLKSIEHLIDSAGFDEDHEDEFDVEGLKKVLAQTAKTLEKLRLDFTFDDLAEFWEDEDEVEDDEDHYVPKDENPRQILVTFPKMLRLTTLELNSPNNGKVGRHLNNLSPKLLPSLKFLKLSSKLTENVLKFKVDHYPALTILEELEEKMGSYQHNGVVKLSLKGVKDPSLLKDLRSFFPNLESLEVELLPIKEDNDNGYEDSGQLLAKLIKALKFLEMKELRIIIPFKYDTLELVEALKLNYMDFFKGLRRFHLENVNGSNVDSLGKESEIALKKGKADPIATFQKILLHMKNVEGLEVFFRNFMINATIAQKMMEFIAENKIPITFT